MNIEQERTEFEAWYRLHHGSRDVYGRDASGEYVDKQVQGAFNVWQARAALTAQPAAATKAPGNEGTSMNTINDGGFAFPAWELHVIRQPEMTGFGMSLRDYFAAKALPAVYRVFCDDISVFETTMPEGWREGIALDAYALADAMLKAREASND